MTSLTQHPQWQALIQHQQEIAAVHLRDLFHKDANRFAKFSLTAADLLFDFSKNHINEKSIQLLCELAEATQLQQHIEALFSGKIVNVTEQLPATHTALRDRSKNAPALAKMAEFCENIHQQNQITDVVNIGIGGSDLGAHLGINALAPYTTSKLRFHFVSSVDSSIVQTLKKLTPANTLFIVSSKSFRTVETLANAKAALNWAGATQNFIAITSKPDLAKAFGIAAENVFVIDDGVVGRYSMWSAMGLPIMLAIGVPNFTAMLAGAHAMDQHFRHTSLKENIPVVMGLLNVWYNNFFGTRARAILPYDQSLKLLIPYLQQAEMESTGKHITTENTIANYATGQIIFGDVGTNCQHSFCQLLHQGTQLIPVDFIVPMRSHYPAANQQAILVANAFAQSQALAEGLIETELHKMSMGNRPSNMLLLEQLTPQTFGALMALYEHKIFVQSVIWQINAFDQWGVELGKQLANKFLTEFESENTNNDLVSYYQKAIKMLAPCIPKVSFTKCKS